MNFFIFEKDSAYDIITYLRGQHIFKLIEIDYNIFHYCINYTGCPFISYHFPDLNIITINNSQN